MSDLTPDAWTPLVDHDTALRAAHYRAVDGIVVQARRADEALDALRLIASPTAGSNSDRRGIARRAVLAAVPNPKDGES